MIRIRTAMTINKTAANTVMTMAVMMPNFFNFFATPLLRWLHPVQLFESKPGCVGRAWVAERPRTAVVSHRAVSASVTDSTARDTSATGAALAPVRTAGPYGPLQPGRPTNSILPPAAAPRLPPESNREPSGRPRNRRSRATAPSTASRDWGSPRRGKFLQLSFDVVGHGGGLPNQSRSRSKAAR